MDILKILLILLLSLTLSTCENAIQIKSQKPVIDLKRTNQRAQEALSFCEKQNLNTEFCVLIDMSLHSGVNRFVLWDFKTNSIKHSFLVSHGCGENIWSTDSTKDNPKFSNISNSHLSSLGKYKIGDRGYSNWGIHIKYFMHGLQSSNNNARKRLIVFHSWEAISDDEVFPRGTPEGWGCPAVSNKAMKVIDPILRYSSKPVMMWVYKD